MSQELGGKVQPGEKREYGKTEMTVEPGNELFKGLPDKFVVWMSHGDRVAAIPEGFKVSARSANCPYAAVRDESRRFFGIQFTPRSSIRSTESRSSPTSSSTSAAPTPTGS